MSTAFCPPRLRLMPSAYYPLGRAIVVAGACAIAIANIYFYLALYPAGVPAAFESAPARFMATLQPQDHVYFVGNSSSIFYTSTQQMLAPQVTAGELLNPSMELPLPDDPDHNLVFIFNDDQARYLPIIQAAYPGGQIGTIQTPAGPIGTTYIVTADNSSPLAHQPTTAKPQSATGLAVTWQGPDAGTRVDPFVGSAMLGDSPGPTYEPFIRPSHRRDPNFVPLAPPGTTGITWEGEVYADGGPYTMGLRTDGRAQLSIDGATVIDMSHNEPLAYPDFFGGRLLDNKAEIALAPGWHPVKLTLQPTGNFNGLEWSWARPGQEMEIVPPWVLRHK